MTHTSMIRAARYCAIAGLLFTAFSSRAGLSDTDPPYLQIQDVLQGERMIRPVSDLLVEQLDSSSKSLNRWWSPTSDGQPGNFDSVNSAVATSWNPNTYTRAVIATRMYNLPTDVVVSAYYDADSLNHLYEVLSPATGVSQLTFSSYNTVWIVPGDFNGDGLSEIVEWSDTDGHGLRIVRPVDPNDLDQGLHQESRLEPAISGDSNNDYVDAAVGAAGDLDGDGIDEIILFYETDGCYEGANFELAVYRVDPATYDITFDQKICVYDAGGDTVDANTRIGITTGHLKANPQTVVNPGDAAPSPPTFPEQIALSMTWSNDQNGAIATFELNSAGALVQSGAPTNPTITGSYWSTTSDKPVLGPQAARLIQVPFQLSGQTAPQLSDWLVSVSNEHAEFFAFDGNLNVINHTSTTYNEAYTAQDFAIGNFDQTSPDALQIAFLGYYQDEKFVQVVTFTDAGPDDPDLSQSSAAGWIDTNAGNLPTQLVAGDFQGRGIILGAPTKQTLVHYQPDLILGAPPMHVDYTTPINGSSSTLEVLNLSTMDAGFAATFGRTVTQTQGTSKKNTLSASLGVSVGDQLSANMNVPLVGSASVTYAGQLAAQLKADISSSFSTSTETQFNASTSTGFGDQVIYQRRAISLWVYPVIGLTACPNSMPGCTPEQEGPLFMVFSGPETLGKYEVNGKNLEWYQPPQEPGNVLTYPANFNLLNAGRQRLDPSLDPGMGQTLTLADTSLTATRAEVTYTDSSQESSQVSWNGKQGQESSAGASVNLSADGSFSASARLGTRKNNVSNTFKVSAAGSAMLSTLQMSKQSFSGSTGVTINKPGTFLQPTAYQYAMEGLIFGTPPAPGTIDPGDLSDLSTQPDSDLSTSGPIELAFLADPTDANAGGFWSNSNYRYNPDLALQLPKQWQLEDNTTADDSCRPKSATGTQRSCAVFNPAGDYSDSGEPRNMWTSYFYQMKGLNISTPQASGERPNNQRQFVQAGEPVTLTLRVYNLSFYRMLNDTVKVRFYRQPWNVRENQPVGDSVLINEVETTPIPPFSSTQLNWDLISTDLDTTDLNGAFVFWAVVWAEDSNGELVVETPEHGLTQLPPDNPSRISDVPVEAYSNNVGFYPVVFTVVDPSAVTDALVEPTRLSLSMDEPQATFSNVKLGDAMEVSAQVTSEDGPAADMMVVLSERQEDGEFSVFDVENLGFAQAGEAHQVRVPYRPRSCGIHEVRLEAFGLSGVPETLSTFIQADIDPVQATSDFAGLIHDSEYLHGNNRRSLEAKLRSASRLFSKGTTHPALALLEAFNHQVDALRGKSIPAEVADSLIAESVWIADCVSLRQ